MLLLRASSNANKTSTTIERHQQWIPANGNFTIWACNNETVASHVNPVAGQCNMKLTDAPVYPYVFVDYWRVYNPKPNLSCFLSSADFGPHTAITWEISDLALRTLIWTQQTIVMFASFTPTIIRGAGMAQAQVVFNLTNLAIGYRLECTATDKALEPHNVHPTVESDQGWFDCVDTSLRVWDQVRARFRFNPDSGLFEIQQNWTCGYEETEPT